MSYSIAEENYIKAIWRLQQQTSPVSTNDLANALQTRPASVTDMLKRLHEKKILHHEPYHGVTLSNEGKKIALHIIRRHRLWEFFLAEKLQFGWDQVHAIAEELEHVSSNELIDRLDAYLAYPKTDPHGDPIPDRSGKIEASKRKALHTLPLHTKATVCAVTDQSSDILELLQHKKITIGTKVEIIKRFAFDASMELSINNELTVPITAQLAQNILVII